MICQLLHVNKSFVNAQSAIHREVLTDISLSLKKGQSMSIVGPSGSGKSTLLHILGTLDTPTSGTVLFDGKDLTHHSADELASIRNQHIGFVFQSHHLLPQLNLLENVLLPILPLKDKTLKKSAPDRAMELLDLVGMADKIRQFPGQLSGGECQRAAVVRALINQPKLILADEPTGSLDEASAQQIGQLLSDLNHQNKVAMIVVTHSLKLANMIGQVHFLEGGVLTTK